jgi:glutathione peroxidase-family protein
MHWDKVNCAAHILQLAIKAALDACGLTPIINQASKTVSHFRHSTVAMAALRKKQSQFASDERKTLPKLKQYCRTRWNSAFDMLESMRLNR